MQAAWLLAFGMGISNVAGRFAAVNKRRIDTTSGTLAGGKAAALTNKAKFGADFYAKIGAIGGRNGRTGGYWYKKYVVGDTESVSRAGKLVGQLPSSVVM